MSYQLWLMDSLRKNDRKKTTTNDGEGILCSLVYLLSVGLNTERLRG